MGNQHNAPYKYHWILRRIYENFGLKWFTFRQLWDLNVIENETESSARTKMNDMNNSYHYWSRDKQFLDKVAYKNVKELFPDANRYQRDSKYWRITDKGIKELVEVFSDLEIEDKHVPLIAKAYLDK